jgi:2-methylcitrate dehydratase PrpD
MEYTKRLAEYVVQSRPEDIPADVWNEGKRALLNVVGCCLGGSPHEAMGATLRALSPYSGERTSAVIGRSERADPLLASLLNGISSHVHDYDDTTPKNYIHCSPPVAPALLAYASANPVSGRDFLHAFILGFEVVSRIGNATYPSYYDQGWHSTGSIGVFGAAVAIGRLLKLDSTQMVHALGLAATQSAGIREMFGSMAKSFHPGRAAQGGYVAALMAQQGFTTGTQVLEGPRGFAAVQCRDYDLNKVTDGLGQEFDLRVNTYKPFPCGIVIHPTIDACIQLHERHHLVAEEIAAVELRVAPLVKDLCNKQFISTDLEGKFSVYHGAAIGLARGKGGLADFTAEAVNDPALRRIRELAVAIGDPSVSEDSCVARVTMRNGDSFHIALEHSLGNLEKPLSNDQLEAKFRDQAGVIRPEQADAAIQACWAIDTAPNLSRLIDSCVPAA